MLIRHLFGMTTWYKKHNILTIRNANNIFLESKIIFLSIIIITIRIEIEYFIARLNIYVRSHTFVFLLFTFHLFTYKYLITC